MTTYRDIITGSLGLLGVYGVGKTVNADDAALCLRILNQLFQSINLDERMVHTVERTVLPLVSGTGAYTYGTGGTLSAAHPEFIESCTLLVGTEELPLHMMSAGEWADLADKSETGTYPTRVYFDGVRPLENVTFVPPPAAACSLVVYSWAKFSPVTSLSATVSMPDGYEEFLETNLAVRLAPYFKVMPDPVLLNQAATTRNIIQSMNYRPASLVPDLPGMRFATLAQQTHGMVVDE